MSTLLKVRVYKINLLSDAIKYLIAGSSEFVIRLVVVLHSRQSRLCFCRHTLSFCSSFFFSFMESAPWHQVREGLLRVSWWFATLKCDAWLAIGRMQIENQYSSNHEVRATTVPQVERQAELSRRKKNSVYSRAWTPPTEKNALHLFLSPRLVSSSCENLILEDK